MTQTVAFLVGSVCSFAMFVLMEVSRLTSWRFWPPEDRERQVGYWILATGNVAGLIWLLIGRLPTIIRTDPTNLLGWLVVVTGLGLTGMAIQQLGLRQTAGEKDSLITDGLYQHSRNPQVLANLLILAGLILLAPMPQLILLSLLTAAWLVSMVYVEEPWLDDRYGQVYQTYRETTPRFI